MTMKKPNKPTKTVAANNVRDLLKIGDRVRILHHGCQQGHIVGFRGSLGPGGARISRGLVCSKPKRAYTEETRCSLGKSKAGVPNGASAGRMSVGLVCQ